MTTKFGIGIVFRKVSAKFNCPSSTVTLFSEYGGTRIHSSPVIQSEKRPANSGGTIVYNYPCYVRRRGWMPRVLLFFFKNYVYMIKQNLHCLITKHKLLVNCHDITRSAQVASMILIFLGALNIFQHFCCKGYADN